MSDVERLQRRFERERRARKQAESLIEEKSRQLFQANQALARFNHELESRVAQATADLLASNELLKRRLNELRALNVVTTALCTVFNLKVLLERIIELSKDVMNAQAASLLLYNEESGKLHFHLAKGAGAEVITDMTVELGQGIAGAVAQSGKSELVPDTYADPRFDSSYDVATGVRTVSLMAVPIKAKDEIIGVVEVINKVDEHPFDVDDLCLFESFASSAAVAIENARLFQKTKQMAEELREALEKERWLTIEREKMGAYISKNVRDEISRNREKKLALGGKTAVASVMFSDIQGFTKLSETMEPQRLVSFLNEYMTAMTNAIEANGGFVDKFIGDGIMAIFTESESESNHALRAVRSGIAMQQRLQALAGEWKSTRPELACLRMRVGINTGMVVAGNIGSETRMDYTVVGDNVNVASRIESACTAGGVFVSQTTFDLVKAEIDAERMEPIKVKNREQPVQTYAIRL